MLRLHGECKFFTFKCCVNVSIYTYIYIYIYIYIYNDNANVNEVTFH